MEYRMIQSLDHVAITSPLRAGHFSDINDFDIEKIRVLPVAPIGEPIHKRSSFFREKFGIRDNSKIVLYMGNFEPWFMCLEIIETVKNWPQNFVLIMHTWNKSFLKTQYYGEMVNSAKGVPVYFSSDYIEYVELAAAISSADIGLMFYEAIDANFSEILFSSNKFGEYLRAGLPIICSDFPSLKEFVEENGVGMAVPVNELSFAVEQIGNKIDIMKKNAHLCYDEKIRFESFFARFYDQLFVDV
jgi:glycosyltransferase involved in cell wall biosynthesis